MVSEELHCHVQGLNASCCGMMFNSRGFKGAASHMGQDLEKSLVKASDGGKIPIVMDTSPCLAQMKGALTDPALRSVSLMLPYLAFILHSHLVLSVSAIL